MTRIAKLAHGTGADNYYGAGMHVPDPFTWYQSPNGETHIILSELEVDRGRKQAKVDHVHAMGDLIEELKQAGKQVTANNIIVALISKDNPDEIHVPNDFPAGIYAALTKAGFKLEPQALLFEGRAVKTPEQIELLRQAQQINEKGFARAFNIFKVAEIASDNTLFWQGQALTSEIIQNEMNIEIMRHGGKGFNDGPIVAGGAQGADPHERGHGPLKAHEFIIIDSYPQGPHVYNGDLTRTVLKGTPGQWHLDVYEAVRLAQQTALDMIKEGVNGKDINDAVMASLEQSGFSVGVDEQGRNYGMFHSTGHGVGLEVHDYPSGTISRRDCVLKAGHVTSVEPGVYYPEKGGCRLEDVVAVTKDGHDNLTTLPKQLVID